MPGSRELENKVWQHLKVLRSVVSCMESSTWRDAQMYADRQLSWLDDDLMALLESLKEKAHEPVDAH